MIRAGCIPAHRGLTRWVEAPFSQAAKVRRVLPTLLDIQLPFALEDCAHVFVAMECTPEGKYRALAAAVRRQDLEAILGDYRQQGLDVHVVDHEGLALWSQGLREHPPRGGDPEPRAVLWIAPDHATLVIGRGAGFVSAHPMTDPDPARIDRLLRAALGEPQPVTWVLAGPECGIGDRTALASLQAAWPGSVTVPDEPRAFLARSLAVRALLDEALACNLRTGSMAHPAFVRRRHFQRMRMAAALYIAAAILFVGGVTARRSAIQAAQDAEHKAGRRVDVLCGFHVAAKGEHALGVVQDTLEQQRRLLMPFAAPFRFGVANELRDLTALAAQHDITLSRVILEPESLRVNGTAPDWDRCEAIQAYVIRRRADTQLARQDALAEEYVPFTITAGALQ